MKKFLLMSLCMIVCGTFAMAQDINDAIKMYNDAATALNAKNYAGALENAQKALEIANASQDEQAAEVQSNIKDLIPRISYSEARQLVVDKEFDRALAALNRTVEMAGLYNNTEIKNSAEELIPQVVMGNANALLGEGKYAEAIDAYNKILANNPDNAEVYFNIGQAQVELNKDAEAITAFEKAASLGSPDANKKLATLYLNAAIKANNAKKPNDVYTNAEKALTYDANNITAAKLLGLSAVQLKKYDVAIPNLEKVAAAESNPDNTNYSLATSYEAKGNKAKACETYKKLVNSTNAQIKAYAAAKVKELCK